MSNATIDSKAWIALKRLKPRHGQRAILLCQHRDQRTGRIRLSVRLGYRRDEWVGGFCTHRIGGGMAIDGATHWMPFHKP